MNAKILKIVSILIITGAVNLVAAGSGGGSQVLRTLDGREFQVTEVVKVDPNGLLFRHRRGIAKVTFKQLDEDTRKEFGYDPAKSEKFEQSHRQSAYQARPAASVAGKKIGDPEMILEVTTATRTNLPQPVPPFLGDGCTLPFAYYPMAPWYSHWSRYQPAHILAHYPYRHWAEHDLLRHSGFLPWQRRGAFIRY